MTLVSDAIRYFTAQFGAAPHYQCVAPGRVNIIGEHTDYNDGFVLPCAIEFHTVLTASYRGDNLVHVVAGDYHNEADIFEVNGAIGKSTLHWADYVRGVVDVLRRDGKVIGGVNLFIAGNIPQGAGLSSSASLQVALAHCFNEMFNLDIAMKDIARIAQRAENEFVGCHCGIMDQLISACGQHDSAVMIDCRTLELSTAQIPSGLELVIINPNIERKLATSEYNVRRRSCEEAASILGVKALRDADEHMLGRYQGQMDEECFRRARHVVTENQRVHDMVTAFQANDLARIHQLMVASHKSMRYDFEITTPHLDFIADTVNELVMGEGGARMTGGGFGGCAVALLPRHLVDTVIDQTTSRYRDVWNKLINFYQCQIVDGAHPTLFSPAGNHDMTKPTEFIG